MRIKWPNDIYFGRDVKLGGIIVKSSVMHDVIHVNIGISSLSFSVSLCFCYSLSLCLCLFVSLSLSVYYILFVLCALSFTPSFAVVYYLAQHCVLQ